MATKRRPIRPNMNFRPGGPDVTRSEAKGTRPTAPPISVREIFVMAIMHVCKKTIFFDTNLKVALYLGSLFLISLIGDFAPFPRTYFARSDNLFNQYFVKIGWGWTLLFSVPFLVLTSYVVCCGDMKKLLRHHLPRIAIATFFWLFWTKLFNFIETSYGRCTVKGYPSKSSCLKAGHLWNGFDISGHAFILIHSSLVLIEEARPMINWETIKEHLRNELHDRSVAEHCSTNPLRYLNDEQIRQLKYLYDRFTPIIRTLFIGIAALQLLWDVMLVGTMLYYHRMIEKMISGIIAILTWYFTYRFWYPSNVLPDTPGSGCFLYQRDTCTLKRRPSLTSYPSTSSGLRSGANLPGGSNLGGGGGAAVNPGLSGGTPSGSGTFMGMPLYTNLRPGAANSSNVGGSSTRELAT